MKKIITIIVAIFMLMAILIACNNTEDPIETTETAETVETTETVETIVETTEDTETEETIEEIKKDTISIFSDGKSEFTIVQSESPDPEISKAGTALKKAFQKNGSTQISFHKEGMYKTINGGTIEGPKIVIDVLEEDEISKEIFESFDGYYFPYIIKVANGSLYIMGGSPEATTNAVNYFIETYLSQKISTLEFEKDMLFTENAIPPLKDLLVNGNSIYDYTIVHYESYYAEQAAYNIQMAFTKVIGKKLPVVEDSGKNGQELEILVGKTSRSESAAVRAEYDRPNVYYDIVETNEKLVIMAEGYTTLELIDDKLTEYLGTLDSDANIVGSAVHGDIIDTDNMLERANDTDLRVMAWNMGCYSLSDRVDLAEKHADVILMHYPDILGTSEWKTILSSNNSKFGYDTVMREISEYYTIIEDSEVDTSYGIPGGWSYPFPQNILYRKDLDISVYKSGYRLIGVDGIHGYHWAIFEMSGNKFIYSVSHYTDSHNNPTCSNIQIDLMKQVQKVSGSTTLIPEIFSGDLYMYYGNVGYNVVPAAGYKDAQRDALVNANNDISHGTFHEFGKCEPGRAEIDLVFYNAGFEALKHKVVVMQPALDSSDHCPVVTDFRF